MRGRLALTAALTCGLAAGFGCSSRPSGEEGAEPADEVAAETADTAAAAPPGGDPVTAAPSGGSREADLDDPELTAMPSGLKYKDLAPGTGEEARAGSVAVVHYTGWLVDGTKFDSSLDRGEPFEFPVGGGRVIKGWDQGVAGMKVGGKRRLVIPPDLGYGARGAGAVIPPDATLIFEVELLEVKPG